MIRLIQVTLYCILAGAFLFGACTRGEPTPDIQATVDAAVATAVANQPTPTRSRTPISTDAPTPEPAAHPTGSILLFDGMTGWDGQKYTKLQVVAARMGAQLTLHTGYESGVLDDSKVCP